jgi:hypothetical protein
LQGAAVGQAAAGGQVGQGVAVCPPQAASNTAIMSSAKPLSSKYLCFIKVFSSVYSVVQRVKSGIGNWDNLLRYILF